MNRSPSDLTYPSTRIVSGMVVPVLLLAFVILYFFPDSSGERFAWHVMPHMSAIYIGAGYLGGAFLLVWAALGRPWHEVQHGYLPITTFTTSMLLGTVLHWGRFDLGHFPFQLWLGLYIVTPILIPALWLPNRREDPLRPMPGDRTVPALARSAMLAAGLGFAVFSMIGWLFPDLLIRIWVWQLSPLSARLFAGWFALLAVGGWVISRETRWSAWRIGLGSIFIWHFFVALGAFWNVADFGAAGLLNWYLILVWLGLAGMAGLYFWMESRPPDLV